MNIHTTELYEELMKQHPDLWKVECFLGKEVVENAVACRLDENGQLKKDGFFAMFDVNESVEQAANSILFDLRQEVLQKWMNSLSKSQAQSLCEMVGYHNSVTYCGFTIFGHCIPETWESCHPDEGRLPIREEWFVPIA